ncbi:Rib/alpha-like domain-containing protein [Anaerococcus hydrogenalis]|uniref:Rib/alpha-like domain-containing protein n=1 Tax=Anaerococcus hydrogenalis TaxID=33029 RepID=UPI001DE11C37|nr:Rib/alpha-like domain-containing protein [Anaerococcus hydrogenalis]MBS5988958.1 YPDG domain-containing protein [Anaerococcus hydrogenalis]
MKNSKKFNEIISRKKSLESKKTPKYGTRKLSIGLVSCILGFSLIIAPSSSKADVVKSNEIESVDKVQNPSLDEKKVENPEVKEDLNDKNSNDLAEGELSNEKSEDKKEEALDLNQDKNDEKTLENEEKKEEKKEKEEFSLNDAQISRLKDAGFSQAEIDLVVENIRAKISEDSNFDVDAHLDSVIKTKNEAKKSIADEDKKVNDQNRSIQERSADIEEIQKGAVYSPGQEGDTQSYSGTAYIYRKNKLNDVGKETLSGVNVYLQWVDYDGYVSKVYKTTTRPDGTFTFNFQKPEVDKYGNVHHFQLAANPNFAIRTWVENPDPEKYSVVKPGDQKYGFHKRLDRTNESWDFTAGINRIVGGQVALQEKPMQNDWLVKPKDEWSKAPSSDGIWENQGIYGNVRGQVWFENGDPKGSDARGWKKDSWDVNATGNEIVGSYVNDEVARLFDKWKEDHKDYKMEDFRKAQEEIIRDYEAKNGKGSHIAETVYTKVDKDGNYYLPFRGLYGISPYKQNSGAKISHTISDEEYGKLVKDEDITHSNLMAWNGTIGQKHRHINWQYMYVSPLIKRYNMWGNTSANNMFNDLSGTLLPIGPESLAGGNIRNVNFALLAAQPMHDIKDYDTQDNYAKPGDIAENESSGLLPNHEYQIQWFKDGKKYGDPIKVTSNEKGLVGSNPLTVPQDLTGPHTFTSAVFYANADTSDLGTALAADSFIASPDASYDMVEKKIGEEAKTDPPKFVDKNGNKYSPDFSKEQPTFEYVERVESTDENGQKKVEYKPLTTVKVGDKEIKVSVDPKTGVVKVAPEETAKLKDGDQIKVPVSIKFNNGLRMNAEALIKIVDPESMAANNEVKYEDSKGKVGEESKVNPKFTDKDSKEIPLPKNTKFKLGDKAPEGAKIDEKTGQVTYTPNENDSEKTVKIPVIVEYEDGSKDNTEANIKVGKQEKSKAPEINKVSEGDRKISGKGVAGSKILLTKASDNEGDIISEDIVVDENGNWEIDLPDDIILNKGDQINANQIEKGKKISDPTARDVDPKVEDKDNFEPKTKDITKDFGNPTSEEEIKNSVEIPNYPKDKKNPTITIDDPKQIPDGKEAGDYEVDITVKYPDGSEDKAKVKVKVKEKTPENLPDIIDVTENPDAKTPEGYVRVSFEAGEGTEIAKTKIYDVKEGKSLKEEDYPQVKAKDGYENPTWSVKPGEKITKENAKIVASAKKKLTDAEKYEPIPKDLTTKVGQTPDADKAIENKNDLPENSKYEWVKKPDVDKAGESLGKVKVTYPDGTSDEVDVKVTVVDEIKDKDKYPAQNPTKTKVNDKDNLTEKEKKEVEAKVREKNPNAKDIEVGANGDTSITYPDGSRNEIGGKETVEEKTRIDDRYKNPVDPKDEKQSTGVRVVNPNKDGSTKISAKDEDGKNIPVEIDKESGEIFVKPGQDVDGPITVTVEDEDFDGGKKDIEISVNGHKKDRDDNKKIEKTDAEKSPAQDPEKTRVKDKTNLSQEEKDKVKEKVKEKNPKAKEIEVGSNGDTTITYPDGSKNKIPGEKTVEEITDAEKNPAQDPEKIRVKDKTNLSQEEKDKVKEKVKEKNPKAKEIEVGANGDTTITYPDGSKNKIPGEKTVEEITDAEKINPNIPEKTEVNDKNNLTDEEKGQVKDKIIKINKDKFPENTKVEIGKDGSAKIIYPDGSVDEILGKDLVEEKKNQSKPDSINQTDAEKFPPVIPEKSLVKDKNNLTNKEKEEVSDKIKKANPQVEKIEIDRDGSARLYYKDGSVNTIKGSDLVIEKENISKEGENKNKDRKSINTNQQANNKNTNVKTGVESQMTVIASLVGSFMGLFASKKKKKK